MSEALVWDGLTKLERRALVKLFGGGSLRYDHPEVVKALRTHGFVDEHDKLAMSGLLVLTLAIRREQAAARWRMGLAA
jgi:hypothetical protein